MELSESLAFIGLISFSLIIARSILKYFYFKQLGGTVTRKGYLLLTKLHPYIGIVFVISIAFHCYLLPDSMKNGVLYALLGLILLQGLMGIMMKLHFLPAKLRRFVFISHTKYALLTLIVLLAVAGHL